MLVVVFVMLWAANAGPAAFLIVGAIALVVVVVAGATGHVGAHDPLQAADEALPEFPADEIVFALRGRDGTAWLDRGVADAARARYAVIVRELES